MKKEWMTPKERWIATLKRKEVDRLPIDFWGTWESMQKLMKHYKTNNMMDIYKELNIDKAIWVTPDYIGEPAKEGKDIYGVSYKNVKYDGGEYTEFFNPPLKDFESVEEIEANFEFPTVDMFNYKGLKNKVKGFENYPIHAGGSEPFLRYRLLRGEEQAYMDLYLYPEIVNYVLDKLFDFAYKDTQRIYESIGDYVTYSYISEDLGSEDGLLISPDLIKEFILPRMKKMMDLAHSSEKFVMTHSDGAIRDVIPEFIKIGTDIMNPIQWNCKGMEKRALKDDFGKKLVFHGAVDNQYVLAFGSTKEIEKEVIENIEIFGEDGGYIIAPCHNVQSVSPVENIITMYKAAYENGWR